MIAPMTREHVEQVAELHHRTIKSLLTDLGWRVCRSFYAHAVNSGNCLGFVDIENGRVRGFAIGALDNSILFKAWGLRLALLPALARHPGVLRRLMFHLGHEMPAAPEVLYEAVDPRDRRQGIATALSRRLADAFLEHGMTRYEVRIDRDNMPNLSRHCKLGARIVREFQEDGISRYLLDRQLDLR